MKKISMLLIFLFVVSSLPALGLAASPWTQETTYQGKMMGKLGYGLKNLLLGWTEIISHPVKELQEGNKLEGFGRGLGTGVFHAIADTGGGAIQVITFPFTNFDVPLPEDGVQCPMKKA